MYCVWRMEPKTKVCALLTMILVFSIARSEIHYSTDSNTLCPAQCTCSSLKYSTNCDGRGLDTLPQYINREVVVLSLNNNAFRSLPKGLTEFPNLKQLYMQYNEITHLQNFDLDTSSLELLELSNNNIYDWNNIHNQILQSATSMKEMRLSHNPIRNVKNATRLVSKSLRTLVLLNCSISFIGTSFFSNLSNLTRLVLSENELVTLTGIESPTLKYLDVSSCHINHVLHRHLAALPALKSLIMRNNRQLKLFKYAQSKSLEVLDISGGNLEDIDLTELPNLIQVKMSDNHIRKLTENTFINKKLSILDLSHNAITSVHRNTFSQLESLEILNLSANTITDINPLCFMKNLRLKKLFLSRNYLTKVIRFRSASIELLDLSVCEIQYISVNDLTFMPTLRILNLSRNLIKTLPNRIIADSLQVLDVSMCRLSDILNETFVYLDELLILNLAGNRLTSGLRMDYFPKSLRRLNLDDNLWHCECYSHDFRQLYVYLSNMEKHSNYLMPVCHSPENVSGQYWGKACAYSWYQSKGVLSHTNRVWLYTLATVFAVSILFCVSISIRRMFQNRVQREQEERERQAEEARERIRRIQAQQQREAQQNAPDPRELQRPPSYAEAVLMPRLDGSYASLLAVSATTSAQPEQGARRKPKRQACKSSDYADHSDGEPAQPAERRASRTPTPQATPQHTPRQSPQQTPLLPRTSPPPTPQPPPTPFASVADACVRNDPASSSDDDSPDQIARKQHRTTLESDF